MAQDDINKDLKHYIHDKHKSDNVWKKMFGRKPRPKEEVQEDIRQDLQEAEDTEDISAENKQELEHMEDKIEAMNKEEQHAEEKHEGMMQRFFKKLNFSKDDETPAEEQSEMYENLAEPNDEEIKEFLKMMHSWITKLPSETQKEFKESKDFELYTSMLKKYKLIK